MNLGRRRWISPDVAVHESVVRRIHETHYRPRNLPDHPATVDDRCQKAAEV